MWAYVAVVLFIVDVEEMSDQFGIFRVDHRTRRQVEGHNYSR